MAPVATVDDIAADPQLAFRAFFQDVDDPRLGRPVRTPGPFARLSATPLAPPGRAPEPGEHNAAVYGEWLGWDAARVAAARREGLL
jgi:crotonobetainyl-CoA:carnitine CoA-transferase CaiB-like acyl-CoA transferase